VVCELRITGELSFNLLNLNKVCGIYVKMAGLAIGCYCQKVY
jgi:hypothetical protein